MMYLRHLLCEDGVFSSFADYQISPLHDHNTDEERRMTRVFKDLPLMVTLKDENTQKLNVDMTFPSYNHGYYKFGSGVDSVCLLTHSWLKLSSTA